MKWTIVICQFGYLAFIAANLYGRPALMYPASVFLGLSGAPLWTSESAYITQIGMLNAEMKGRKSDTGVTHFFGIFFAIFQTSQWEMNQKVCTRCVSLRSRRPDLGKFDQFSRPSTNGETHG